MSALENSLARSRSLSMTAYREVLRLKAERGSSFGLSSLVSPSDGFRFDQFNNQAKDRRRYAQFRGYVHSAVNALAQEGAGQPAMMGKLSGKGKNRPAPKKTKEDLFFLDKMPLAMRAKAASEEMQMIASNPILDLLNRPNPVQYKYQFVYSFIANLCLTGWGYLVAGESEDGGMPEIYSLPTTWVRPSHKKGPFSEFKIVDPKNPASEADATPLTRDQVAFACLPDPSDPLSAMSPVTAQAAAIAIDEKIQSSQVAFFDNGIFPSAVIHVGKNPHPDVPGGIRPRLTAAQRRQVYGAIKKVSSGVSNYGNPAIVDGLIEKIERFSMVQDEMGWEKSEKTIRSRILSAFGVHPFVLGEEMAGSYAQAYIVQERFAKKVNVFLDLLSGICTDFVPGLFKQEDKGLLVWFEKMSAIDPSMRQKLWGDARKNGDVSQNEFRSFMGLPPDEDSNEAHIDKGTLAAVVSLASQTTMGRLDVSQTVAILEGMGLPNDLAVRIAGDGVSDANVMGALQQSLGRLTNAPSNEPPEDV